MLPASRRQLQASCLCSPKESLRALFKTAGSRAGNDSVGCCLFIPKDKAELRTQRKGNFIFSETLRIFSLCKSRTQLALNKK